MQTSNKDKPMTNASVVQIKRSIYYYSMVEHPEGASDDEILTLARKKSVDDFQCEDQPMPVKYGELSVTDMTLDDLASESPDAYDAWCKTLAERERRKKKGLADNEVEVYGSVYEQSERGLTFRRKVK
jgi:hypothetical protein